MERPATDKYFSLFGPFASFKENELYNIDQRNINRNLFLNLLKVLKN
jgi:hypothetical protein